MFGHCLWWVIPTSHSWVRNARTIFGKVSHPLHVTVGTHVAPNATDPRVPTLRISDTTVRATSQDGFHALELPVRADDIPIPLHLSILYSTEHPLEPKWTLQRDINALDWSEPCIPFTRVVDCSQHFSTWNVL